MEDCIFCKIISSEIKSHTIYENQFVKAFLDINPWTEGHTLVIPKKHYENIFDIPEKELTEIILAVKKISLAYRKIFNCDINLIQSNGKNAQQEVPHFHIHIVPRYENDGQKPQLQHSQTAKQNLNSTFEKISSQID